MILLINSNACFNLSNIWHIGKLIKCSGKIMLRLFAKIQANLLFKFMHVH